MAPQNGSSEHVGNYFSDRYFVSLATIFLALILKKGPFYLQDKKCLKNQRSRTYSTDKKKTRNELRKRKLLTNEVGIKFLFIVRQLAVPLIWHNSSHTY